MGRQIKCDQCDDAIHQEHAEQGWFRLSNECLDMELWFCSAECIINYLTMHAHDLGETVDDDDTGGLDGA